MSTIKEQPTFNTEELEAGETVKVKRPHNNDYNGLIVNATRTELTLITNLVGKFDYNQETLDIDTVIDNNYQVVKTS